MIAPTLSAGTDSIARFCELSSAQAQRRGSRRKSVANALYKVLSISNPIKCGTSAYLLGIL